MNTIAIKVKRDTCLGYEVFRGSIKAKDLAPALWIDFHDQELNPWGYQRPFNKKRSEEAAQYAESDDKAFWPECILAIRDNSELDTEEESYKVEYDFIPEAASDDSFGTLHVKYNDSKTEVIEGETVPWRRAFSQVDCQHRLGSMLNSDKYVTVCIIPGITRLDEARIFKAVNDKQKRVSTSLVDVIVMLLSKNRLEEPDVHWAYNLGIDYGSKLYKLVNAEGRNLKGYKYTVTLRTLKACSSTLIGGKRVIAKNVTTDADWNFCYEFMRNYWNAISELWPVQFGNATDYKLMLVPGLKGLSRYGKLVFNKCCDDQDIRKDRIKKFFPKPDLMDWSVDGVLRFATGNTGAKPVYEELVKCYGKP